jgi:hypothetical protein
MKRFPNVVDKKYGLDMGSVTAYETNAGKPYRVVYRKSDHVQTQERGFRTKRDAELFLAKVEIDKSRGAYVDPAKSRVLLGSGSTLGWRVDQTGVKPRVSVPAESSSVTSSLSYADIRSHR